MLSTLWLTVLYQPLFNALIWIYNTIADKNLGWAVVWLTVFLRITLLPLTLVSEYNNLRRQKALAEAEAAIKVFKNDTVAQKEAARKIMRKYHISPWAKVLTLGIQLLVLIVLYQVFIQGITGERVARTLYPAVDFPGRINTNFYGFDIGERHNLVWAGAVALYLFLSIFIENRRRPAWDKSQMTYLFVFPALTFAVLWYLPMVKSLFILTTIIFSDIIGLLRFLLFSGKTKPKEAAHH